MVASRSSGVSRCRGRAASALNRDGRRREAWDLSARGLCPRGRLWRAVDGIKLQQPAAASQEGAGPQVSGNDGRRRTGPSARRRSSTRAAKHRALCAKADGRPLLPPPLPPMPPRHLHPSLISFLYPTLPSFLHPPILLSLCSTLPHLHTQGRDLSRSSRAGKQVATGVAGLCRCRVTREAEIEPGGRTRRPKWDRVGEARQCMHCGHDFELQRRGNVSRFTRCACSSSRPPATEQPLATVTSGVGRGLATWWDVIAVHAPSTCALPSAGSAAPVMRAGRKWGAPPATPCGLCSPQAPSTLCGCVPAHTRSALVVRGVVSGECRNSWVARASAGVCVPGYKTRTPS